MTHSQTQMPITPSLVSWARVRAGYSLADAEKHFKKIALWENGESSPTYPQLEQLAERFKVPVAVFFFPEPPDVPRIDETFRTLTQEDLATIPSKIRLLLRKARAMQINLAELHDGKNPSQKFVTRDLSFNVSARIDAMARSLREYLQISVEEQMSWASVEVALENWRQILVDYGVYVFKDAFREENFCGFCLYDESFPIIYVNNTTAKTRQIFTIFHELAHLIFHTSGVDLDDDGFIYTLPSDSRRIEVICNRFAGQFLVPDDAFEAEQANLPVNRDSAAQLASLFCVSREVIYRKFLDRGLIDRPEYESAAQEWRGRGGPKKASSSGNYYYNQMSYLGRRYVGLAFEKFYQNRFDSVQLAEYLNVKPKNIPNFEEKFLQAVR